MGTWNAVATGTSFTATNLTTGRYVQFDVQGLSAAGTLSAIATQTPRTWVGVPTAPTTRSAANGITGGTVTGGLTFSGANGAATYDIQWSNANTMTNPNLTNGAISGGQITIGGTARTVYMQVRSVNALGTSAWVPATPLAVNAR
jgi:hypothetical protein